MQEKYCFLSLSLQSILQEVEKGRIKLLHAILIRKYDSNDVAETPRALRSFVALRPGVTSKGIQGAEPYR